MITVFIIMGCDVHHDKGVRPLIKARLPPPDSNWYAHGKIGRAWAPGPAVGAWALVY